MTFDRASGSTLCLAGPGRRRKPDTGLIRGYRPKPPCFRETYIRMGWDGIEEHYRTNWRVIRRWILQEGRDGLVAARAEFVKLNGRQCR